MFCLIIRATDFLILAHINNIKTMVNPIQLVHCSQNSFLVLAVVEFFTVQSLFSINIKHNMSLERA